MSIEAINHALELCRTRADLTTAERLILLLLANRHNPDEGIARPSIPGIARESGIKDRAVQYAIRRLEGRNLIERIARDNGAGRSAPNGYRFPAMVQPYAPSGVQPHAPKGATVCTAGVQRVAPKPKGEPIDQPKDQPGAVPAPAPAPPVGFKAGEPHAGILKARARADEGRALVARFSPSRVTASMLGTAGELLDLYAGAGRAGDLAALVADGAGKGWRWSGFVAAARDHFQGNDRHGKRAITTATTPEPQRRRRAWENFAAQFGEAAAVAKLGPRPDEGSNP